MFFRLLDVPLVSQIGVRMVPPSVQTRVALRIAYFDDSKIDPEEVEIYAAPLKTAAGKHAIIHSARQIVPEDIEELVGALQDHRAADADPVVRPRPHRAARSGPQAQAHAAQLNLAAGRGLRTHAAGGAAGLDPGAAQGLYRRLKLRRFRPFCPSSVISFAYCANRQIRFALIMPRIAMCGLPARIEDHSRVRPERNMDAKTDESAGKCPFTGGAADTGTATGGRTRWTSRCCTGIPTCPIRWARTFDYAEEFKTPRSRRRDQGSARR